MPEAEWLNLKLNKIIAIKSFLIKQESQWLYLKYGKKKGRMKY